METETLIETAEITVARVMGRPRAPEDGRHRKAVVFVGVEVSTPQVVGLLRDAADRLAKTLQVVE